MKAASNLKPNGKPLGARSVWEMDEMRIVTGAMVILSGATALLVVMPYMLLKNVRPPAALKPYTAVQLEGRQVYIANGCVYCHSQQPRDIKQAPDASRGWGRASVAADYAYDTPHLLGTSHRARPAEHRRTPAQPSLALGPLVRTARLLAGVDHAGLSVFV